MREITLIGQDTTCYGEDLGLKDGLPLLLERLAHIEDLRWIRFLYAYPNKITGKLLDTIAAHEKVCSYIDVPLQHASAAVLKRMKRGGGADIYLRSIEKMRRDHSRTLPCGRRSSSASPAKPKQDFERALRVRSRRAVRLDGRLRLLRRGRRASFSLAEKVSPPRNRTPPQAPDADPDARSATRQEVRSSGGNSTFCWKARRAETDLLWEGRTVMHAPEIDGKLFVNDFGDHGEVRAGEFHRCEITEAHDYDLVARLL